MFDIVVLKQKIYMLMLEQNISFYDLGKFLGYSEKDINNILFGEVLILPSDLKRIADFLGVSVHQLLGQRKEE